MDKSTLSDVKKRLKNNNKILRDMNIVFKTRTKFGTDNKNEALNCLRSKYGVEKGNNLVEEYWNSFEE
jgi:hypothetical protein